MGASQSGAVDQARTTPDQDCYDDQQGDRERDELPSCDATASAEQRKH